jgi:hypothetical protein
MMMTNLTTDQKTSFSVTAFTLLSLDSAEVAPRQSRITGYALR